MKKPDIRLCLGRGGSGKTFLVDHWLSKLKAPRIIFDANGEDIYARWGQVISDRKQLLDHVVKNGGRHVVWRGVAPGDFEFVNEVAWALENLTLVWEEVDQFGDSGRLPPHAFKIVNQGRHRNIRVIACSRRPARVSRDMTANASRIVAFRTREPRDLAFLKEWMGSEAVDQLPGLAEYNALDWTEAGAKVRKSPFA